MPAERTQRATGSQRGKAVAVNCRAARKVIHIGKRASLSDALGHVVTETGDLVEAETHDRQMLSFQHRFTCAELHVRRFDDHAMSPRVPERP